MNSGESNNNQVPLSILVPAYNAERTLARTLDSVTAQTMDDWECVIVDDGSTDETFELAKSYTERDMRFKVMRQDNAGTASALNAAAAKASGHYLVQLGADDELLLDYCEKTADLILQNPDFDIYASNAWYCDLKGNKEPFHKAVNFQKRLNLSVEDLIKECCIYCTAAVRRSLFEEIDGFRVDTFNEDYDLWLRLMVLGARHIYQPEYLAIYHRTPHQKTSDHLCARKSDLEILKYLVQNFELTDSQLQLACERKQSLARDIAIRERLYSLIGRRTTESLISLRRKIYRSRA